MKKAMALLALAAATMVAQQNNDNVYKVGNGVLAPKVLQKVDPNYTQDATAAKIEGPVLLSVVIGTDGVARDIKVIRSLDPGLDNNAIAAIQSWKFQPGTKDGWAVNVQATIEVNFKLK
jgi:TonB family protein